MSIRLIATDMDGTFLNNEHDYDHHRFKKVFDKGYFSFGLFITLYIGLIKTQINIWIKIADVYEDAI